MVRCSQPELSSSFAQPGPGPGQKRAEGGDSEGVSRGILGIGAMGTQVWWLESKLSHGETHNVLSGELGGIRACWGWGVSLVKKSGRRSFSRLSLEVGDTCGNGSGNRVAHLSATQGSWSELRSLGVGILGTLGMDDYMVD